jgi:N-acetylglucosaminylphosphatidylinositol deacetylase
MEPTCPSSRGTPLQISKCTPGPGLVLLANHRHRKNVKPAMIRLNWFSCLSSRIQTMRACSFFRQSCRFGSLSLTPSSGSCGSVRCQELQKVCDLLGVDELIQVDRPEMQDHPSRPWSIPDAARAIEAILADALKKADLGEACLIHLITFDEGGVSGHVNHRDCYRSVRNLLAPASLANPSKRVVGMHLWTLETVRNPIRKYLPFIEWIILILTWIRRIPVSSKMNPEAHCFAADVTSLTLRLSDPALNWKAMSMHASQFVWYRRLFVVFSCYTYVNRLQRVARQSFGGGGIRKGR